MALNIDFWVFLTGSIHCCSLWSGEASVSMCSRVNRKHPCRRWQLNRTVQILLVPSYLPWQEMRVKRMGRGPRCLPCQRFGPWTERYHEWNEKPPQWPFQTAPIRQQPDGAFCVLDCVVKMSRFFSFVCVFSPTRPPQKGYPRDINCLCCSVAQQSVRRESPEHKQTLNHRAYSAGSKRESTTAKSLEPGYQTCSQTAHNICRVEVCWCVPSAHMHVMLGGPLGNAATNREHQQYLTAQLNRSDLVLYVDRIPDEGPSEVEA